MGIHTDEHVIAEPHPDLERGHHHEGKPGLLSRIARFSAVHRKAVMLVWLLVALAAAPLAITLTGALSGAGWEAQGSTSQEVRDELRSDFAALGAEAAFVVYQQEAPLADDPAGLQALVTSLADAPGAVQVVDPLQMPLEAGLLSQDGRTALIPVALEAQEDADLPESAGELGDFVGDLTLADGTTADVTGEWAVWSDFNRSNEEALHKAELLSGLPSMILLLVAFGSLLAAGLPLLLAVAGIAVGFASLHLLGMLDAAVGVVDELLDDDRPGRGHRLQPVHRQPLPGRTRRRCGHHGRHCQHAGHRRQGGLPLCAHRGVLPRRGVRGAGDGVPFDGAGHDPVGRGRGHGVTDVAARRAGGAGGPCAAHTEVEAPAPR